ncbi:MAG: hypothetical protein K2Y22_15525 [Candidatus Obscuribacterales bacterium]|nr:hypothetical protein [Candidatus Obscuribacterales bacterium]
MNKFNSEQFKEKLMYGWRMFFFGWLGAMSVIVAVVLLITCSFSLCSLPSDSDLISQFQKKKPVLLKLLEMSNEDEDFGKITREYLGPAWVGGMPKDRWQTYRELFDSLGLRYGVERFDNDDVLFVVATNLAGDAKGYAHLSHPPKRLVSSLKDSSLFGFWHDNPSLGGGPAYREIQDGWYLCRTIQF